MKKSFALLCIILTLCIVGCAKQPPEKLLIDLTQKTTEQLSKATTGKEAGDAIIAFAKETSVIIKQYPTVKETIVSSEFAKEFEQANTEFVKSVTSISVKFGSDKDFQKALEEFSTIIR